MMVHRCFRCQHFNYEVINCPFPWGPCWRRIQQWRRLLKASRAGEFTSSSSSAPAPGVVAPTSLPSTIRAEKSALSISQAPAASPTAEGLMCAGTVCRTTLLQNVILQAQSPLNLDSFQCYLACHLDRQWSESLLQGICKGVDIGFQGERKTVWSGNWKSAVDNGSVFSDYLTTEVGLRRKAGLFNQLLFSTYIGLPMGIVIKKCSDSVKYHIIHDLSWPPGDSINDHIDPDLYSYIYASFDQAVSLVKKQGVGIFMAKLDLADAFKHILVCPEDWPLLCSSWDVLQADGLVLQQYYIDLFLPFGLCSSPAIFNHYANTLEFAMWANGIKDLLHYLDNYFAAGPTGTGQCQHNISTMVQVCRDLGFVVNPAKVTSPSSVTNFLGIDIDSSQGVACIDPKHLQVIMQELSGFCQTKLATKHKILSLIGKLHFVCSVCPPDRAFLCHMIDTSKKACYLHHRIKLNTEFWRDMEWWLTYLPSWKGVSFLYKADWTSAPDMELLTDASNKGFSCYFQGQWCQGTFPAQSFGDKQMSINWHELYVVTMVLALWGPQLAGKHLLFHCNNASMVHIMARASSCSKTMMVLVCTFTLLVMWHNMHIKIQHIAGVNNDMADVLSCFEMDRFQLLCLQEVPDPLPLVTIW